MKSLKGQLLIASPRLLDPNFVQTVVLMVQHDENGALGLVLNRPTELNLRKAWEQVSQEPCERDDKLYIGGPCEGVLMVLHPYEHVSQIEVLPGLHFATETESIKWLVQQAQEKQVRFFVGYAGWSAGQLEGEMESGSWLMAPATVERIFTEKGPGLWRQLKREIELGAIVGKVNPRILPADPRMN